MFLTRIIVFVRVNTSASQEMWYCISSITVTLFHALELFSSDMTFI